MPEFIEIDFVEAGDKGSGDAIAIRHCLGNRIGTYVVDGGYSEDGQKLLDHFQKYYGNPQFIDHVVLTHPDADHASGLETVLTNCRVGCLWMNRPWLHIEELMPKFERYQDRDGLIARLKRDFPKAAELEQIANGRGIEIRDAFRGVNIGAFTVLSPSKSTYLDLVVESDKTPVPKASVVAKRDSTTTTSNWGEENLKGDIEGTSAENETSVVLFANLCGNTMLLTGDAGTRALTEAYEALSEFGQATHELNWFQAPHHGSRRNLSSDLLDFWLGPKLQGKTEIPNSHAIISANTNDPEHPKKAVIRALIHRGRRVVQTNGILHVFSREAPTRNWSPAVPLAYPSVQED